jgi:aryl-phospho-beta-D-glucosidase BglC (GH1 family)
MDYNILETEDERFSAEGFERIRRVTEQCRERGLRVVLDLHKTAGFSFDKDEQEEGFFTSAAYQERFWNLWDELSKAFYAPDRIAFEMLNEVTDEAWSSAWNKIAAECIRRIRKNAPDSVILLGGYHNNSAEAVKDLDAPADERVIYNIHCYDPLPFTHQGAFWVPQLDINARVSFDEAGITPALFEEKFASAIAVAAERGTGLYCGEYGVIEKATPEDTLKWFKAIHEVFEKHQIARSVWSYRQMDFGVSDPRMDGVREELVRYL